ncbi:MAG: indole-3-glycerol phosphate synthase TrpC [Calditrichaeota bacterium]|nr:MAG: indole-3-glycerol phosphate synthase TrpC [Calditrichota bacterium]
MQTILRKIIEHKRREVAAQRKKITIAELEIQLQHSLETRSLAEALTTPAELSVIAEVKKGSPSEGTIREDFDPVSIAQQYSKNGAHALSVLTDEKFFQGHLRFISAIRPHVAIPVLRKDFIIDEYQLIETRVAGADAVLLIVAALSRDALRHYLRIVHELKMEAIVEVHNEMEMARALETSAKIIGINNRNLDTFKTDLAVTEKLAPMVGKERIIVGESGISTQDDRRRMSAAGVQAVLVGTHFMRQNDPGVALANFRQILVNNEN